MSGRSSVFVASHLERTLSSHLIKALTLGILLSHELIVHASLFLQRSNDIVKIRRLGEITLQCQVGTHRGTTINC